MMITAYFSVFRSYNYVHQQHCKASCYLFYWCNWVILGVKIKTDTENCFPSCQLYRTLPSPISSLMTANRDTEAGVFIAKTRDSVIYHQLNRMSITCLLTDAYQMVIKAKCDAASKAFCPPPSHLKRQDECIFMSVMCRRLGEENISTLRPPGHFLSHLCHSSPLPAPTADDKAVCWMQIPVVSISRLPHPQTSGRTRDHNCIIHNHNWNCTLTRDANPLENSHTWPGLLFMLFPHLSASINPSSLLGCILKNQQHPHGGLQAAEIYNEHSLLRDTVIGGWNEEPGNFWNVLNALDGVEILLVQDIVTSHANSALQWTPCLGLKRAKGTIWYLSWW